MYPKQPRNERLNVGEPANREEAEAMITTLAQDIKNIEEQLHCRQPNSNGYSAYKSWKKKAMIALALKSKDLNNVKNWLSKNGGSKNIPSEDDTMSLDYNMPTTDDKRYADISRCPQPDKIIDNLCGAIIQMRGLKWRLHPYRKIAKIAFDILDDGYAGTHAEELQYWLYKAGFAVEPPPRNNIRTIYSEVEDGEESEDFDSLEDTEEELEMLGLDPNMPKKQIKY